MCTKLLLVFWTALRIYAVTKPLSYRNLDVSRALTVSLLLSVLITFTSAAIVFLLYMSPMPDPALIASCLDHLHTNGTSLQLWPKRCAIPHVFSALVAMEASPDLLLLPLTICLAVVLSRQPSAKKASSEIQMTTSKPVADGSNPITRPQASSTEGANLSSVSSKATKEAWARSQHSKLSHKPAKPSSGRSASIAIIAEALVGIWLSGSYAADRLLLSFGVARLPALLSIVFATLSQKVSVIINVGFEQER